MNKLVSGFWSTSGKTLNVRFRSGLEIGCNRSGDTGDNGVMPISFPELSGFLVSGLWDNDAIFPKSVGFHS